MLNEQTPHAWEEGEPFIKRKLNSVKTPTQTQNEKKMEVESGVRGEIKEWKGKIIIEARETQELGLLGC